MFLDEIRPYLCGCHNDHLSHPAYSPIDANFIRCSKCGHSFNVHEFILNASTFKDNDDPFLSSHLAYSYAEWSGDIHVPCEYLVKIDTGRILPSRIRRTRLSHLLKGINVLKALNSPFLNPREQSSQPPGRKTFQTLMDDYVTLVDRVCRSNDVSDNTKSQDLTLRIILNNMKSVFAEVDFFEQYFEVLVPYVKSRFAEEHGEGDSWRDHIPATLDEERKFAGLNLYREINRSDSVRLIFSKYCIAFDVAYVMALCYICADDSDLLYNLVLDLAARLCTRYFYGDNNDDNEIHRHVARFIKFHTDPKKNIHLHYLVRQFRQGEGFEEYFSSEFIKKFGELDHATRNALNIDGTSSKLVKYKYQQSFPYILFEGRDEDYYGFVMALAYYASKTDSNPNFVAKGLISNCKKIYRFVKNCILRIRYFERQQFGSSNFPADVYWTKDVFNLFICTDSNFENEMITMLKMMLNDHNDNPR